jgi:hypothetical protein
LLRLSDNQQVKRGDVTITGPRLVDVVVPQLVAGTRLTITIRLTLGYGTLWPGR